MARYAESIMKIAIDFEGTLLAECGEFRCEPSTPLALLLWRRSLRQGTRSLLNDLHRAGHSLTLYSSQEHTAWKLWLWCQLAGLPIQRVRTVRQERQRVHRRSVKNRRRFAAERALLGIASTGELTQVAWPPAQGHDLVLDDDRRHVQAAWRAGVRALQITNYEEDWTSRVREATLHGQGIEVLSHSQLA